MNVTPAQTERMNAVKKYYASLGSEHPLVGYSPPVKVREPPLKKASAPFVEKIPRHWTIVNNSVRQHRWKTYMDE
jgi:hypothetical protein